MPAPVGVVVLDDAGLLLDDLGPGTRTGHGGAQEDVDDQHDEEHDAERDAQVQQPVRVHPAFTQLLYGGHLAGFEHEDAGAGH